MESANGLTSGTQTVDLDLTNDSSESLLRKSRDISRLTSELSLPQLEPTTEEEQDKKTTDSLNPFAGLFERITMPDDVICNRFQALEPEKIASLLQKVTETHNKDKRIFLISKILNGYNKYIINGIKEIKEEYNDHEIYADELYGSIQIVNWMDDNRMNVKTPEGEFKSHFPSKNGKYSCETKKGGAFYEIFTSWNIYVAFFSFILIILLPLLFLTPFKVMTVPNGAAIAIYVIIAILSILFIASLSYTIYSTVQSYKNEPCESVYAVNNRIDKLIEISHNEIVNKLPNETVLSVIKKCKLKNPSYTELFSNYLYTFVLKPTYNHLFLLFSGKLTQPEYVKDLSFESFEDIFTCYRFICSGHFGYNQTRSMYKLFSRFFTIYLVNSPLSVHEKIIKFAQLDNPYSANYSHSKGLFIYKYEREQIIPTLKKLYKIIRLDITNYDKDMPKKMENMKHIIAGNRCKLPRNIFKFRLAVKGTDSEESDYTVSELSDEERSTKISKEEKPAKDVKDANDAKDKKEDEEEELEDEDDEEEEEDEEEAPEKEKETVD